MIQLNFNPFPQLETHRLLLRRITRADANAMFELRSDIDIMRHLDKAPARQIEEILDLIEKMESNIENTEGIGWGMCLKPSDRLIGVIGFHRIVKEHHRAEIGYMLKPKYHIQGLMHEAMQEVLSFGWERMNLHSVEANIKPDNTASKNLLLKNGFVSEAYFKENYFFNGKFLDSEILSLIRPKQ